jgi:hypothetical protein
MLDVAGSEVNEGMSDVVDDDEEDVSCDVDVERMDVDVSMLEVEVVESDETLSNVGVEVGCWLTSGACGDGESCGPLVVGSVLSEMNGGPSSLGC